MENIIDLLKKYAIFLLIIPIIIVVILIIKSYQTNDPILSIVGDSPLTIYQGEQYVEYGYNLNGNSKGYQVLVIGNVQTANLGTYIIKYQLVNSKNKIVNEKERIVNIIEDPLKNVKILLNGPSIVYVLKNNPYVEERAVVTVDNVYNPSLLQITDNIDINKAGTYQVIYKVTLNNRVKTATRIVKVFEIAFSSNIDYKKQTIEIDVTSYDFDHITLPNGKTTEETSLIYQFASSGNYVFTVHTIGGYEKKFQVTVNKYDNIAPTATCKATISGSSTNVVITANDDSGISKYTYNNNDYTSPSFTIGEKLTTFTVRVYDTSNNFVDVTCKASGKFNNNMDNIIVSNTLIPCNFNVSSYEQELATLVQEMGYKTRDAVAAAAEYLAKLPYKIAYSWGGKSTDVGFNKAWGCEREVTKLVCSKQTGDMKCIYGMDCTGYTSWAFAQAGFPSENLRTSSQSTGMWGSFNASAHKYSFTGNQDKVNLIKPGDIVHTEDHVGIVIGTSDTMLKVANMHAGIQISFIKKSNGASTNGDKSFDNFVLFDDFFKMYGN